MRLRRGALITPIVLGALMVGCSPHQNPPATPVDNASTPTNRSFTNSTDQPNTPFYTQPGVNPGKTMALKPIPSQAGFSQNTPLAMTVYNALTADHSLDARYIAVQTKGADVLLVGSVSSAAQMQAAEQVAKKQKGVAQVADKLTVKGAGT